MTPALVRSLTMVADRAGDSRSDWWVIGSAAVALHGRSVGRVRDIDLLMSADDADAVLRRVGVEPRRGAASDRFRSAVFGTWVEPPVPVEVMGGFEIAIGGRWQSLVPASREAVGVGDRKIHVPSATELAAILESFGRPKDLERARLLR